MPSSPRFRRALKWLTGIAVTGVLVFWFLISPTNIITRQFRIPISDTDAKVITGPYPEESDLKLLRNAGVTTIISLMNPDLPYEAVLIDREKALAEKYGMTMSHFPMISIWGHPWGADYDKNMANAAQAVELIANQEGKVYLHCYLGLHRAHDVMTLLEQKGILSGTYAIRQADRSPEQRRMDQAQYHFDHRDYAAAIAELDQIPALSHGGHVLKGWACYRQNLIPEAAAAFDTARTLKPDSPQAACGLGYCRLRAGNLTEAETLFQAALSAAPGFTDAHEGMGYVCYRQQRYVEAREHLDRVVKDHPQNSEVHDLLEKLNGLTAAHGME